MYYSNIFIILKSMFVLCVAGSSSISYNTPSHADQSPRLAAKDGMFHWLSTIIFISFYIYICNNTISTGNPYGTIHGLLILRHRRHIGEQCIWKWHEEVLASQSVLLAPSPLSMCIRAGLQGPAGAVFVWR